MGDVMDEAYSKHGTDEIYMQNFSRETGRRVLKWILNKWILKVRTGFIGSV
jgi:hypothetical protein